MATNTVCDRCGRKPPRGSTSDWVTVLVGPFGEPNRAARPLDLCEACREVLRVALHKPKRARPANVVPLRRVP